MSMIKCKECNNEISDKADTCPHCGIKVNEIRLDTNTNTKIDGKKALKILIGIVLFLAGLGMFFNGLNNMSNNANKTKNNGRITYDEKTDTYMYRVYP